MGWRRVLKYSYSNEQKEFNNPGSGINNHPRLQRTIRRFYSDPEPACHAIGSHTA
jgi:hypothetical protein